MPSARGGTPHSTGLGEAQKGIIKIGKGLATLCRSRPA
nr:MAG TPA: hypothetical protein [Inoviridae sp.]